MQTFYKVLGAAAVVGVGVIGWQMTKQPAVSIPANVTVTVADTAGFHGYILGSDTAPVTIVEYSDYQCPYCGDFDVVQWPDVYEKLVATGKLRWIYRDFPLDGVHRNTRLASHAAACADDQGKFWPMKARIFAYQQQWSFGTGQYGKFRDYVKQVGGDQGAWDECMQSARHAGRIQASSEEGNRLGVNSTPTFLLDGRLYREGLSSDQMRHIVDSLIAARAKKAPAAR